MRIQNLINKITRHIDLSQITDILNDYNFIFFIDFSHKKCLKLNFLLKTKK